MTALFAGAIVAPKFRAFDANGDPLAGGKLYTYVAGTSTPLATYPTYADALAGTNANANPVILDANGEASVFGTPTLYKLTLHDSADALRWTMDYVPVGLGTASPAVSEWVQEAGTLVYSSSTQFKVSGVDVTSRYHAGRRIKTTNTGGTIYSTVASSSFGTDTTINVVNDSGTLDSGLSAAYYGLLSYSNPSYLSPRTAFSAIKNGDQTDFNPVTQVTAWTEQVDSLAEFTTPTLTVKFAGVYVVNLQIEFADSGTDVAVTGHIYVNGSPVTQCIWRSDDTSGEIRTMALHYVGSLSAGDTVEVYVTGSDNTTVKGTSGTRLSVVRIA